LYCLLFNHQAERPSVVVGFAGIAIWYAISRRTSLRTALLALAFIAGPVVQSDLVPSHVRLDLLAPLRPITIACLAVWVAIQTELLARRPNDRAHAASAKPAPRLGAAA
jgi:hypothetical protein